MNQLSFRQADAHDAQLIISFQMAMALETEKFVLDHSTCTSGVNAVFADPAKGRYFLAERNGNRIACLLTMQEWSDWRNGAVLWIHSVYVVPQERGHGVFSQFYAFVKNLAEADPSVRGLRLYVDKTNTKAQAVYRKIGMNGDHYQLFEWMKSGKP